MIIADYFGADKGRWDTRILATDISQQVLETARKGIYSLERIAPLPAAWRNKYFHKLDGENAVLSSSIKNEVIFRKFNLMEPVFPFRRKFQVIFCRNVMIYFDWETKTELVNKFYEHLEEGGYLFVGHSESLNREKTKFEYIRPAVYRKSNA
jgi:chemotaxis protein methyltransferase CheR